MSEDHVLIWSPEKGMWWRPERCGYTASRVEAGTYERADAERIVAGSHGRNGRIEEMTEDDRALRRSVIVDGRVWRQAVEFVAHVRAHMPANSALGVMADIVYLEIEREKLAGNIKPASEAAS